MKLEIDAKSSDGNSFVIAGFVIEYLRKNLILQEEIDKIIDRMLSLDYDNLCKVVEEVTNGDIKIVNR